MRNMRRLTWRNRIVQSKGLNNYDPDVCGRHLVRGRAAGAACQSEREVQLVRRTYSARGRGTCVGDVSVVLRAHAGRVRTVDENKSDRRSRERSLVTRSCPPVNRFSDDTYTQALDFPSSAVRRATATSSNKSVVRSVILATYSGLRSRGRVFDGRE